MPVVANLQNCYKRSDAERSSGFDPPTILFIPKATTLKMDSVKEFNLCVTPASIHFCKWYSRRHFGVGKTNLDGTDGVTPARLQKEYLGNHIEKPNKLTIENAAARLCYINGILLQFPAPTNDPMVKDELCNILYPMAEHKEMREA
eukprot:9872882-Ditylum_brightwellii.AAC.1